MAYTKFIILFLCPFVASLNVLDTNISDDLDTKLSLEILPEDQFFDTDGEESDHAARNRRSPRYNVLESRGLKSHFRSGGHLYHEQADDGIGFKNFDKTNAFMQNIAYDKLHPPKQDAEIENFRVPRSVEPEHRSEDMSTTSAPAQSGENLPKAEKQVMDDYHPERRNQPMPMDRWTKSPFDYSKVHNEEDSLAEATSVNEGIKARTPRVNFITQQKSSKSDNPNDSDQKSSATKPEIYRSQSSIKPIDDRYYRRDYEELPYYRDSDPYSRRFDRFVVHSIQRTLTKFHIVNFFLGTVDMSVTICSTTIHIQWIIRDRLMCTTDTCPKSQHIQIITMTIQTVDMIYPNRETIVHYTRMTLTIDIHTIIPCHRHQLPIEIDE